jgi:DNA-binding NtrC family response regulator
MVSQRRAIPAKVDPADEILIVEDEQTARRTLGLLLSSCGFHPRAFPTAEQALAWLERGWRPAIALIDLDLPGMDGLELIDRMQNLSPLTRPILVTATDDQILSSRLRDRSLPYLRKPLDFDGLLYVLSHPPSGN